jgi:hypothetical protein
MFIIGAVAVLAGFAVLYEAHAQVVEADLLSIQWTPHAHAAELPVPNRLTTDKENIQY